MALMQVVETSARVLGPEHPSVLRSMKILHSGLRAKAAMMTLSPLRKHALKYGSKSLVLGTRTYYHLLILLTSGRSKIKALDFGTTISIGHVCMLIYKFS
jgi:hypothetical protein